LEVDDHASHSSPKNTDDRTVTNFDDGPLASTKPSEPECDNSKLSMIVPLFKPGDRVKHKYHRAFTNGVVTKIEFGTYTHSDYITNDQTRMYQQVGWMYTVDYDISGHVDKVTWVSLGCALEKL
jgi:hypothetical protein